MTCRPDRWLFGLPLLLLLAAACLWRIEPGFDAELRRVVGTRLGADLAAEGVRLDLSGRDVVVVADAPPSAEREAAVSRLVADLPGIRRVTWTIDPPHRVAPFDLAAERRGAVLRLSGHVPPGPLRPELLRIASGPDGSLTVDDGLRTATGEPADFATVARVAVGFAALLPDGRVRLADNRLELAGTAPDPDRYDAALALSRTLPPGLEISVGGLVPPRVDRFVWTARKTDGRVALSGFVPSEAVRAALSGPAGARTDATRTARGPDPDLPVEAVGREALAWLDLLQEGEVTLDGRTVSGRGTTPARDLAAGLEAGFRARLPDSVTAGAVTVRVVPARPFRFEARRADGRVTLSGFVPSEDVRTALSALVRQRFPFEAAIMRDLHLADGAPPNLASAAELALGRLSAFADGEAVIVDRDMRLSGRILYPEMAERARRGFGTGLPDGWSASVDVQDGSGTGLDEIQCGDLLQDAAKRDPVTFEAGSAELGPSGRKAVAAWAEIFRRCRRAAVTLVGVVGQEADAEKARDLGARRARAVAAGLGPALDGSTARSDARRASDGPDRLVVETTP